MNIAKYWKLRENEALDNRWAFHPDLLPSCILVGGPLYEFMRRVFEVHGSVRVCFPTPIDARPVAENDVDFATASVTPYDEWQKVRIVLQRGTEPADGFVCKEIRQEEK